MGHRLLNKRTIDLKVVDNIDEDTNAFGRRSSSLSLVYFVLNCNGPIICSVFFLKDNFMIESMTFEIRKQNSFNRKRNYT